MRMDNKLDENINGVQFKITQYYFFSFVNLDMGNIIIIIPRPKSFLTVLYLIHICKYFYFPINHIILQAFYPYSFYQSVNTTHFSD